MDREEHIMTMASGLDKDPENLIVNCVQRLVVYETRNTLYIIGSNNLESKFRVLKIDRSEPRELNVLDDKCDYTRRDIQQLIDKIIHENKRNATLPLRRASAHGIVGFVRLLEGYYLILVTKRRKAAQIGHHMIYKIDETAMMYIPYGNNKVSDDEKKYLKIFQNVDLSSNFYFSYSYDLSHTLQYNLSPFVKVNTEDEETPWETKLSFPDDDNGDQTFLKRTMSNPKYVWNEYLLKDIDLHPDWKLNIIHGFVSQANISVYGLPIYLTLIARRSKKFAGTRFLKRGANFEGDVANEVETEQIVHDSSVSSFARGRFTSFVQLRGSVPSHWSQDVSKMVPKPLITLDIGDPFYRTAGKHFNQLMARFGAPIIVLNLVKNNERRPHETVLSNEFISAIRYLNQFLPSFAHIIHIGYDMAYKNKAKDSNVMTKLSEYAFKFITKTGIFRSFSSSVHPTEGGVRTPSGRQFQTGVVRVNCVDCLDRTNTAAFVIGKAALGLQLHALGVLDNPDMEYDTDTVRMLEELYEDHGDTIALQYGGSQLVHKIKTYRKIDPFTSHTRDIMQTLSRYYSNTFSDNDKQNAINVFLGVYVPYKARAGRFIPDIWNLQTDFFLHNFLESRTSRGDKDKPLTCWWSNQVVSTLPLPSEQVFKGKPENIVYSVLTKPRSENTDSYYEQYRPYELKTIQDTLTFEMLHTGKDFKPPSTTDYSPFKVRGKIIKRKESDVGQKHSLFGFLGGSSHSSSPSPSEADSDDDEDEPDVSSIRSHSLIPDGDALFGDGTQSLLPSPSWGPSTFLSTSLMSKSNGITFSSILGKPEDNYGVLTAPLSQEDEELYKDYVNFGQEAGIYKGDKQATTSVLQKKSKHLWKESEKNLDSSYSFTFKPLDTETAASFRTYLQRRDFKSLELSPEDEQVYEEYISSR